MCTTRPKHPGPWRMMRANAEFAGIIVAVGFLLMGLVTMPVLILAAVPPRNRRCPATPLSRAKVNGSQSGLGRVNECNDSITMSAPRPE